MTTRSLAVVIAVSLTGCAPPSSVRVIRPDLHVGTMGETTRFEREMQRPVELDDDGPGQPATPTLFWTGTVLGIVGAAGAISFGAAGAAMDNKLENGFADGLTVEEERKIRGQGRAFNGIAIGSLAAALVGIGVASIVYGIDYTGCGPLAPEKRGCKESRESE